MSSVFVSMDVTRLARRLPRLLQVDCPRCAAPLSLHQPEKSLPERMLGTCDDCFAWYLIDGAEGLMVLLPDENDLRNA